MLRRLKKRTLNLLKQSMDKGDARMRRVLSVLLVLTIVLGIIPGAFAASGSILESRPNYKRLLIDVAVEGLSEYDFYASVDDSELIEIEKKPIEADEVGHIVVIDLAWTWTSTITEEYVLVPAIQEYLYSLDSQSKVKFIMAGSGSPRVSSFMSISEGHAYIRNNLKRVSAPAGTITETAIDSALETAFMEATQQKSGDPIFKTVFALVDPANPGKGMSATSIRNSYMKEGNSFPVLIATIKANEYINSKRNMQTIAAIEDGIRFYSEFARANGSQLDTLEYNFVANQTFRAGYNVSQTINNRSYYTLDLSPIHKYIDYSKTQNELWIYAGDSRGNREEAAYYEVSNKAFPTQKVTPVPQTPPPIATPTPIPYVVQEGDDTSDAKKAIKRLQELYYLQVQDLPGEFDDECSFALMDFCDVNEWEYTGNISFDMYDYLMSDEAIPKPTPTPTPMPPATPAPTPIPPIYKGAESTKVLVAIRKLQELYYLDTDKEYDKWTDECMLAFQDCCAENGIKYTQEFLDDEMYNLLVNGDFVPKQTPPPAPIEEEKVEATIPPEGFRPGEQDTDDSKYIAKMQIVLQNLNLYTETMKVGILDQATVNAVELYCQEYGMELVRGQYIAKNIIEDILENGPNRKPYEKPEPTMSEKFTEFLQRSVMMLGEFSVKMWMLIALIVALLFVIILIIILSRKKPEKRSEHSMSLSNSMRSAQVSGMNARNPYTYTGSGMDNASMGDDDATRPSTHGYGGDNDDATVKLGSGINVTLNISGGVSSGVERVLISSKSYIIGRPTKYGRECDLALAGDDSISRKHVALYYQDKQLYVRDLASKNGTSVNGQKISGQAAAATSDETVPLGSGSSSNAGGYVLKCGDVIEINNYRISVNW